MWDTMQGRGDQTPARNASREHGQVNTKCVLSASYLAIQILKRGEAITGVRHMWLILRAVTL